MKRAFLVVIPIVVLTSEVATVSIAAAPAVTASEQASDLIFQDDFQDGAQWVAEFQEPGTLHFSANTADVVAPAGATLWFRPKLKGPLTITYQIQAVAEGGPYDLVSDLNCFWMASDPSKPNASTPPARSGKFEDYNTLHLYYVGLGGNRNTTSRMRRYIGDPVVRPYLPENDRSAPEDLLQPNVWQSIKIVANGSDIRFYRDGKMMFHLTDPKPYTEGWFGLRTTLNHMRVRHLRIYRLRTSP